MTWRFVGQAVEPLPGIGEGPLSDEEFEERVARYESQFDEAQHGSVKASGMYVHEAEPKPRRTAAEAEGQEV